MPAAEAAAAAAVAPTVAARWGGGGGGSRREEGERWVRRLANSSPDALAVAAAHAPAAAPRRRVAQNSPRLIPAPRRRPLVTRPPPLWARAGEASGRRADDTPTTRCRSRSARASGDRPLQAMKIINRTVLRGGAEGVHRHRTRACASSRRSSRRRKAGATADRAVLAKLGTGGSTTRRWAPRWARRSRRWEHPDAQKAFERKNEFSSTLGRYYFNDIDRISTAGYIPTERTSSARACADGDRPVGLCDRRQLLMRRRRPAQRAAQVATPDSVNAVILSPPSPSRPALYEARPAE